MARTKTFLRRCAGGLVLGIAALVLAVLLIARVRGESLTTYLGSQVVAIANASLVPQLSFEELEYEAPYRLTMRNVKLIAPDQTEVLDLGVMSIKLSERPKRGTPIKVAEIVISDGVVRVVQDPETGELRGLVPFVKRSGTNAESSETTTEGSGEESQSAVKLSEVFELRRVVIENLDLEWDPGDGSPTTRVPGFALDLNIHPASGASQALEADAAAEPAVTAEGLPADAQAAPAEETALDAGWYVLAFDSGRAPGLELDVEGKFNIDTFEAVIDRGFAELVVSPETISSLPGIVQDLLTELNARGDLTVEFAGRAPLREVTSAGNLNMLVSLNGFNITPGELKVPISELVIEGGLAGGTAQISRLEALTLGGRVRADAQINLVGPGMPAEFWWEFTELDLEQLFLHQDPDTPPPIAGLLNSTGTATANITQQLESIGGQGEVHIADGRLVKLPVLTQLANAADAVGFGESAKKNHTFDAAFTFEPAGVRVSAFEAVTTAIAARGKGLIRWDGTLNMEANAGPLEKLQGMLGAVGNLFGQLTDSLLTYLITGPINDPQVSVSSMGLGESKESKQERRGEPTEESDG